MLFYRIFSFIVPAIIGGLSGVLFWRANLAYFTWIAAGLASFLGAWLLVKAKVKPKRSCFFYALFSLLQTESGLVMFLFLENFALKLILAAAIVISNFLYLNELFVQYFKKALPQLEKLWSIFYLTQLFLAFFMASILYGLRDFLSVSLGLLLPVFFILTVVLSWYHNWSAWHLKISPLLFRVVIAFIVSQMFWAVSLLPLVYYLKGLLLALWYAVVISLVVWQFGKTAPKKIVRNYLIIAMIVAVLILATAQWF